ncbi:MAG: hypothetical protein GF350_03325 [Chitinivibrionales bacterium]|nr:hypothetical protein [Chitinivibrionales bacterium]
MQTGVAISLLFFLLLKQPCCGALPDTLPVGAAKADSLFRLVCSHRRIRMKELAPTQDLFKQAMNDHKAFYAFIRTNSRGAVVNELVRNRPPGEKYRDIRARKWYAIPRKTMKPYYAKTRQFSDTVLQLISYPVKITTPENTVRFGGVVMGIIDQSYFTETPGKDTSARKQEQQKNSVQKTAGIRDTIQDTGFSAIDEQNGLRYELYLRKIVAIVRKNPGAGITAAAGGGAVVLLSIILLLVKKNSGKQLHSRTAGKKRAGKIQSISQKKDRLETVPGPGKQDAPVPDFQTGTGLPDKEHRETKQEEIYKQEIERVRREVRDEIMENDIHAIRMSIRDEIIRAEKERIEREEKHTIARDEERRIREQSGPAISAGIREQIYREERLDIEAALEKKLRARYEEQLNATLEEFKENALQQKIAEKWSELSEKGRSESREILDGIDNLSASLKSVKTLESLEDMVDILKKQKGRFKYFNLDSESTAKLIAFLENICLELNNYFDSLDSSTRGAAMRINSLLNHISQNIY